MRPFDLAILMQERPATEVVQCVAWDATVILAKPSPAAFLRLHGDACRLEKDEAGKILDQSAGYAWGVDVLCETIIDEAGHLPFGNHAARIWLTAESSAVAELLPHAMRLSGLGDAGAEQIDQLKKNSPETPDSCSPTALL
jgi:hypothetical protein